MPRSKAKKAQIMKAYNEYGDLLGKQTYLPDHNTDFEIEVKDKIHHVRIDGGGPIYVTPNILTGPGITCRITVHTDFIELPELLETSPAQKRTMWQRMNNRSKETQSFLSGSLVGLVIGLGVGVVVTLLTVASNIQQ